MNGESSAEQDRALTDYFDSLANQSGLLPHLMIDDLLGIERYRHIAACPDAELLAAYAEDRLAFAVAMRVGAHVNRCPLCGADVADLREQTHAQPTEVVTAMSAWTTPFVGREADRNRLRTALASGRSRLLTLAAPSGMGKTRLALETATEQTDLFPDGISFVGLTGQSDATLAAQEIARVIHLPLSLRSEPTAQLRDHFARSRALLVLDDLAPGSPAAAMVGALTERCAGLHCLSTARGALGLTDEQVVSLPPLEIPSLDWSSERLLAGESVQLFTERVYAAMPDYVIEEPDIRAAAAICRRAAGTPLGIELAAATVGERTIPEIAQELEHDSTAGTPSGSLHQLVAWSFDRLPAREQTLLARCSVFAEGFFATQAAEICVEEQGAELLTRLSSRALVQRGEALGRPRYRLLESVRAYAGQRLGADTEPFVRRHASYFLGYARERAEWLQGKLYRQATEEFALDLPNLRAGMDRGEALGELQMAGGYEDALYLFLQLNGLWPEGARRAQRAAEAYRTLGEKVSQELAIIHLAVFQMRCGDYAAADIRLQQIATQAGQRGDIGVLAEVEHRRGIIARIKNDYDGSIRHFETARHYFETVGEQRKAGDMLTHLGKIAWNRGELDSAETLLNESLALHRRFDNRYSLSSTLSLLANVLFEQERIEESSPLFDECLEIRRELNDVNGQASTICNLGMVALAQQDFARADYCFAEAYRRWTELNDRSSQGFAICYQGCLALAQGDLVRARERLERSLAIHEEQGDQYDIALAECNLARVAHLEQKPQEAGRLYGQSRQRLMALGGACKWPQFLHWFGTLRAEERRLTDAYLLLQSAIDCYHSGHQAERAEAIEDLNRVEAGLPAAELTRLQEYCAMTALEQIIAAALIE